MILNVVSNCLQDNQQNSYFQLFILKDLHLMLSFSFCVTISRYKQRKYQLNGEM